MKPFEPESFPPKDIDIVSLMPLIGAANRAIATLDGLFYGIPNPNLLLSPITTQEAVLSSKIEGTQANLEDVLKFEAGEPPTEPSRQQDIHEIINYRKALRISEKLLQEKPFCLNSLLKLHEILMDSVRGYDKARGHFRTIQNWIGKPGSPIEEATFVPPAPLDLQSHLNSWEAYWHADDAPDVLLQLAVIHAQFEILHPFIDGNGRIGRMIIPLFLFEKKILSRPCFYLSAYFEANREEYIARLRNLGQPGSWTQWCAFFLKGVQQQSVENERKARAILQLYNRLKDQVVKLTHSQHSNRAVDFIFEVPIFSAPMFTNNSKIPKPSAARILNILRHNNILFPMVKGKGRRAGIFIFRELLNIAEGKDVF